NLTRPSRRSVPRRAAGVCRNYVADAPKPAPDLFLHAAERMGAAPGHCLVIEDSVPGVTAGVAAGMTVFGFSGSSHCEPDHNERLMRAGATKIFPEMSALGAALLGRS